MFYLINLFFNLGFSGIKTRGAQSTQFMKWVHSMTGASFLLLGVSILKYGSQLETSVTHSLNMGSPIAKTLEGLDVRILSITIMLSLVFLCRALLDFMFAFNLLKADLNNFLVVLIVVILTEVLTSVTLVSLMKKREREPTKTGDVESEETARQLNLHRS